MLQRIEPAQACTGKQVNEEDPHNSQKTNICEGFFLAFTIPRRAGRCELSWEAPLRHTHEGLNPTSWKLSVQPAKC